MFDFRSLDDVDADGAVPEWMKWQGVPEWQRMPKASQAVLDDLREERFAAPTKEDDYVFEKLEVPNLPEDDAFDPLGLAGDSIDAIDDKMASYNGQVIVNFIAGAFEDYMTAQMEREQRKAYIESLHQERLAIMEKAGPVDFAKARKPDVKFDRKSFGWREVNAPLVGNIVGLPDGGAFAESLIGPSDRMMKSMTKIQNTVVMPTSSLIQLLVAVGNLVRPMPDKRLGRNAEWHIAVSDVFFPSGFILDDGREYISKEKEAPALVHLVAMSINKEAAAIEAKHLLETVKLSNPNLPPLKRMGTNVRMPA